MSSNQLFTSPTVLRERQKQWYILRYVRSASAGIKRSVDAVVEHFNAVENAQLDLFAPSIIKMVHREGKFIKVETPLTFQYVFIKGDFDTVKRLCVMQNGFSFVLNRGSEGKYAIVSDARMYAFRRIAMAYRNELPFFSIDDIDLEFGDKVEIVEGSFPGLVGYYMPRPKSNSGNLVLAVSQNLGTVVYDVKAKYVRVLEFSKKTKRGYDQIDAFIPKLFVAMRSFSQDLPLSDKSVNELTVFCRRMEAVRLDNPKIEAKLAALLMAANCILGNNESYATAFERFARRQNHITSTATRALVLLLSAVTQHSLADYRRGVSLLQSESATEADPRPDNPKTLKRTADNGQRKMETLLQTEYDYYSPHFLPE